MAISKSQRIMLKKHLKELLFLRDKCCLKCNTTKTLQASHIYSVGAHKKMEYNHENIILLCYRCHFHFWHRDTMMAREWIETVLPKERLRRLYLQANIVDTTPLDFNLIKLDIKSEIKKLSK